MAPYNIAEAAGHLAELADKVSRGEKILFAKGSEIFQIVRVTIPSANKGVRTAGTGGEGWMAADFDEPIEDMTDYM